MDIFSELETAAKWAKINSYVYLFDIILAVLYAISAFIMLPIIGKAYGFKLGFISFAAHVFWIAFYWICRKVFMKYQQSLTNATQSLSSKEITEVCHYQRNVFITFGLYYLIVMVMSVLMIGFFILVLASAIGSMSGAVD